MMKKTIVLVAVLLYLGSLAFGAGRTQQSTVPTLVWYDLGAVPGPADQAENVRIMSDYAEQKIGVRFEIRNVWWDGWDTLINSAEPFDIAWSESGMYARYVPVGVYADITDLLPSAAPALWNFIPQSLWDGMRMGGRIYAVPAYKDSSGTLFLFWDKKYVDKYNLNTGKRPYTLEDFDKDLRTVKAGEGPAFYPLMRARTSSYLWRDDEWTYDGLSAGVAWMAVRMNDPARRVISTLEQPETLAKYKILRAWYKDGIINPDAPQLTEVPRGRTVADDWAWPSKAETLAVMEGIEAYVPVELGNSFLNTSSIRGSLIAVGANSRYKNEALKFIELINTDHKFRDMLAYGIEGKHFRYVSPNVVERLTDTYMPYEWTQGTFFTLSTTVDQPPTTWDEVRAQNERAVPSVVNGFSMDVSGVRNEIANIKTVSERYSSELVYGDVEPEVLIPRIMAELRAVGFDKVVAEAQRQIDEYYK
ncbi:MAG: ABC transporter substrate-binding protein [Treponema sp.]|jgi:putative aldouronate transport system substrate-binding protein|nr:ABC transporter substrate-binding protein [Treponema sp.]